MSFNPNGYYQDAMRYKYRVEDWLIKIAEAFTSLGCYVLCNRMTPVQSIYIYNPKNETCCMVYFNDEKYPYCWVAAGGETDTRFYSRNPKDRLEPPDYMLNSKALLKFMKNEGVYIPYEDLFSTFPDTRFERYFLRYVKSKKRPDWL